MNNWDIDRAVDEHRNHPILSRATRFLSEFRHNVNENSDGWSHWPAPGRAAKQLMALIKRGDDKRRGEWPVTPDITEADLKRALGPIKAFATRKGFKLPELP